MAKSSRASSKKANNQRKAANIFGPAESARAERLSARLLELAKQAKPESSEMNVDADEDVAEKEADAQDEAADNSMDVDSVKPKARIDRKRVDKRRQKKASIAFKKYSDRNPGSKKKKATK